MRHINLMISVFLVQTTACGESGNGVLGTEVREVALFSEVENTGSASLYIDVDPNAPSNSVRLRISGDENLLDEIDTRVAGNTLILDTDDVFHSHNELKVTATVPAVGRIALSGSGDIEAIGMADTELRLTSSGSGDIAAVGDWPLVVLSISGSGDVQLSGNVEHLEVSASGSGRLSARGLSALDADVVNSGSGDVSVCVTGTLDATTSGSGDVDYYCNPDHVNEASPGSGHVDAH